MNNEYYSDRLNKKTLYDVKERFQRPLQLDWERERKKSNVHIT